MNDISLLKQLDFDIEDDTNVYFNSKGQSVPRVTEILSRMLHSDALMVWANNIGLKGQKYRDVLNRAANYGSTAHAAIENYLKKKIKNGNNIPFLGFLLWEETLKEKGLNIDPILVEYPMACDWFGGTCDAVLQIGDKVYLVDFKTSNRVTYKYFLQLAGYVYMLYTIKSIKVDGVIVLQFDKNEPGFNEYALNFSNPEHYDFMSHCQSAFFSLVYAYWHCTRAMNEYNSIF